MSTLICPYCGNKVYEPDWIDGKRFLDIIKPFYLKGSGGKSGSGTKLNGILLEEKDRVVIYKLITGKYFRLKGRVAERILINAELDHTVLYD